MADNVIDALAIEIEANATQSIDGVKRLSRALSSLANSVAKVNGAGINNVSAQIKVMSTATTQAGNNADKASNGTNKYSNSLNGLIHNTNRASNSSKSLAYYFGKMYANCFLLIRGIKAIGKATESAMDYIEAFNFYDVAINSATAETTEWQDLGYDSAESYATGFKEGLGNLNEKMTGFSTNTKTGDVTPSSKANLGINLTDLTTYEAEIVSITSSLGLMTQTSYDTAQGLSMLAADMSSLHNIDLKTVMTNFQSGLIGQSRALYKYGIDITNATLSQYALANGVTKSVQEMSQAEKMQLRMLAILDQSKVAWGDLANTINQPANQLRVFTNGIKNLAITIGKLLLPVVSGVLPYLNAMVKALQTFFTWLANVAGIELDAGNAGSATSDVFDDIEDSADNASDSVNKVSKALKQLAGFDELNNISSSASGSNSGSGGGAGIDLSGAISSALENYNKAWEEAYNNMTDKATQMADSIVDAFKRKDYKGIGTYISTGITNALNSVNWSEVYRVAEDFGSGFAEFLNGLITPELFGSVGTTIASVLNTAIYNSLAFSSALDWNNIGESIASGINNFFTTFDFKALAESLNTWVDGLETAIGEAISNISWDEVFSDLGEFLRELDFDTVLVLTLLGKPKFLQDGLSVGGSAIAKWVMNALKDKFAGTTLASIAGVTADCAIPITAALVITVASVMFIDDIDKAVVDAASDAIGMPEEKKNDFWNKTPANIDNGEMFNADGEKIGEYETGLETLQNGLNDFGDYLNDWYNNSFCPWTDNTNKMWTDDFNEMGEGLEDFSSDVSTWFSNIGTDLSDWYSNSFCPWIDETNDKWADDFDTFKQNIANFKDDFVNKFGEIKDGIVEKWDSVVSFWENKPTLETVKAQVEDIKQKVSGKWDSVKTFWKNKPTLEKVKAQVENIKDKVSPKWNAVKTFWNNKPSLKQISVKVSDFFKTISDKWSAVKRWWGNLSLPSIWADIKLPHISVSWIDLGKISIPSLSVKYYAKGGFPTMGEAFVAGEAGAEMVGNINGRTGVASNAEITGIADAVYNTGDAQLEALLEQNRLLRALLEKDTGISTRDIFNAVRSEDKAYRNINGHSALEY